tara:strand:+ start:433 stop:1197 length:765 start_codon:yes stop_codon:yes gene_type:complete
MTGILAIMDLLYHGASKVHALGFDFLRSGYYNEKAIDLHVLQSGWHNTSNLKRFLHDLLGKEKRFSADPHLKSILDSEFSNNFDHEKTFNLNLKNECKKFLHPYSQQPLLLIRSSNRFSFDKTLSLIRNFNENPPIHIISSSENSTDSNELKIYFHPSLEKKISPQTLKDLDVLKKLQFQYCIIFYNGKGLHEYLNIFEILNHLKCSNLFLLSELGFLRKVLDIKQTISEINEFLAKKERFDYLNSKYNRENCI